MIQNDISSIPKELTIDELLDVIVDSAQDIKAKNIVKIDLREVDDAPVEYFIICQGESTTQVAGIAENIKLRLKRDHGIRANHVEGIQVARWVLLDYFDVVVHVFYPETRELYDIEDLWGDGVFTHYDDV